MQIWIDFQWLASIVGSVVLFVFLMFIIYKVYEAGMHAGEHNEQMHQLEVREFERQVEQVRDGRYIMDVRDVARRRK